MITIKCACGCEKTLEYDGVTKASLYLPGHDKREKPPEEVRATRSIQELLSEKKRWKFQSSPEETKRNISRAEKKLIREKYGSKCVVCGKLQSDQIAEATIQGKRPASLTIYQLNRTVCVPICMDCFKLARRDKNYLHEQILDKILNEERD